MSKPEYPTGEPFLQSASILRHQLQQLHHQVDPYEADDELSEAVFVGRSMGGLISKMQVTESENDIWNAISKGRFDEVVLESSVRRKMAEASFFQP